MSTHKEHPRIPPKVKTGIILPEKGVVIIENPPQAGGQFVSYALAFAAIEYVGTPTKSPVKDCVAMKDAQLAVVDLTNVLSRSKLDLLLICRDLEGVYW